MPAWAVTSFLVGGLRLTCQDHYKRVLFYWSSANLDAKSGFNSIVYGPGAGGPHEFGDADVDAGITEGIGVRAGKGRRGRQKKCGGDKNNESVFICKSLLYRIHSSRFSWKRKGVQINLRVIGTGVISVSSTSPLPRSHTAAGMGKDERCPQR
jgi:hypothetical protein